MAKIHTLKIKNFRGIQNFEQVFGITNFVCLIGRGDSGKTTLLNAISSVLSASWNLAFYDTDFFNGDLLNPIEIEVSLYELNKKLLQENKFGLYIRGINKFTQEIHDDIADDHEPALTIKLIVEKDLEPKWFIINGRGNQEPIEIKASDRASLNVFLISDYVDRHFSWSKGNPLYSLLKQEDNENENTNIVIDILRDAKSKIDAIPFTQLDSVIEKVKNSASSLGVNISNAETTIDIKDITIKDDKVCLHDGKTPFRLKGKGSKRLISIAIQLELAKDGGIILIDEIEQGLEPDRAQNIAKTLKESNKGQIFITTHSRDVLVELEADNLFKMKKNASKLNSFDKSLQGALRSNPEAFFSEKIIVCEGPTEIGICRGLNNFRIKNQLKNASYMGVRFANGNGSSQFDYAKSFLNSGYSVSIFCDSDEAGANGKKAELIQMGIKIIDCDEGNSIEKQLFTDLPFNGIKELVEYRIKMQTEDSVKESVTSKYVGEFPVDWKNTDSNEIREAFYKSSVIKGSEWFKRTDHGEFIASVCCKYLPEMVDKRTKIIFDGISNWIDNA